MKKFIVLFLSIFLLSATVYQTLLATTIEEYSGVVVDRNNRPIASASVFVKGSRRGTTTNYLGSFTIMAKKTDVLEVMAVGYVTKTVPVATLGKKIVLSVAKKIMPYDSSVKEVQPEKCEALQEVSFSGYGAFTKSSNKRMERANVVSNCLVADKFNTEGYAAQQENEFKKTIDNPLSTFSLDVDAASYSNVRRFLNDNQMPETGAVRVEEMINYFSYNYPQPVSEKPFSVYTEYATAPWNPHHGLLMVALQGKKIPMEQLPASNLVFLIDVSGSMMPANKLPLVQASMKLLVDQLRPEDKVTIVTYAGRTSILLNATSGEEKRKIKDAIDGLSARGSTNGGAAIELAYKAAQDNFIKGGNNRIILCTDGDFNVGQTSNASLERMIEEKKKTGIYLTVLGYGMGNYKDDKMEILAQKGNGNHAYIDGLTEAKKVLIYEFGGTLFTIAKDVKFQLEFNPMQVQGYRLVGYESRLLSKEDFNDDTKDAGDMGSGHTVTAFYEIIPNGVVSNWIKGTDALKYQSLVKNNSNDLATVKLRYKAPDADKSMLIETSIGATRKSLSAASENFRFASAVAAFGQLLSDSKFKQNSTYVQVYNQAKAALGKDEEGYRHEFLVLVNKAAALAKSDIAD